MNFFIIVLAILCFIYIYNTPTNERFDYVRRNQQINESERITGFITTECDRAPYPRKECTHNILYDKQHYDINEFRYSDEKLVNYYKPYSHEPCSNTQSMQCRDI